MKLSAAGLTLVALLMAIATPMANAEEDAQITTGLHTVGSALLHYIPNRINDIADTVHASIGFGLGYGFSLRATHQMSMDITDARTLRFGFNEGGVVPQVWDEIEKSGGAALGPMRCGEIDRDPDEVGASVHLGVIGADAAIDLYEVADALLGLILVDISEDDDGPVIASRRER